MLSVMKVCVVNMNFLLLILVVSPLLVTEAHIIGHSYDTRNGTINIINLGQVDGKNYLYDKLAMPWSAARSYCLNQEMKLAKVNSVAQVEFLKSKYNATGFTGMYWLGARDAKIARALSWDDTEQEVAGNVTGQLWRHVPTSLLICGVYLSSSAASFEMDVCSKSYFPICET